MATVKVLRTGCFLILTGVGLTSCSSEADVAGAVDEISVPNVIGWPVEEAVDELLKLDLSPHTTDFDHGTVVSLDPVQETRVERGTVVNVIGSVNSADVDDDTPEQRRIQQIDQAAEQRPDLFFGASVDFVDELPRVTWHLNPTADETEARSLLEAAAGGPDGVHLARCDRQREEVEAEFKRVRAVATKAEISRGFSFGIEAARCGVVVSGPLEELSALLEEDFPLVIIEEARISRGPLTVPIQID